MSALSGAVVGLLAGVGTWVAAAGLIGVRVRDRQRPVIEWSRLWWRAALVVGSTLGVWALTGWPMAGVSSGGLAVMVPLLVGLRRSRDAALDKTEALAAWAEMLRDTIAAHAGLNQAIATTARVAPPTIRPAVRALAARAERDTLSNALRHFAVEVADPVGDLIVAALVIADERQAQKLTDLLSEIASSARDQAAMRMRVETGRARTYASSRSLVVITLVLAVALMVFSPEFLDPYDTLTGQVVLGVIGALFAGALWGLVLLGRPVPTPRLLAGVETGAGR